MPPIKGLKQAGMLVFVLSINEHTSLAHEEVEWVLKNDCRFVGLEETVFLFLLYQLLEANFVVVSLKSL